MTEHMQVCTLSTCMQPDYAIVNYVYQDEDESERRAALSGAAYVPPHGWYRVRRVVLIIPHMYSRYRDMHIVDAQHVEHMDRRKTRSKATRRPDDILCIYT